MLDLAMTDAGSGFSNRITTSDLSEYGSSLCCTLLHLLQATLRAAVMGYSLLVAATNSLHCCGFCGGLVRGFFTCSFIWFFKNTFKDFNFSQD